MQNMNEIKKKTLNLLSTELSNYGFDAKLHGNSFWKQIGGGRSMINFSFIKHNSDYDVTISVSLRIDIIEDMINSTNTLLTRVEKLNTSTIGCELGNLISRIPRRYTIDDSVDLEVPTSQMMEAIKDLAFPFIEKYSNLETLMETSLRDDENVWILEPFHYKRAQNAVALAKILNYPNIESIIESKRTFLESKKDFGLRYFNEFVNGMFENRTRQ